MMMLNKGKKYREKKIKKLTEVVEHCTSAQSYQLEGQEIIKLQQPFKNVLLVFY